MSTQCNNWPRCFSALDLDVVFCLILCPVPLTVHFASPKPLFPVGRSLTSSCCSSLFLSYQSASNTPLPNRLLHSFFRLPSHTPDPEHVHTMFASLSKHVLPELSQSAEFANTLTGMCGALSEMASKYGDVCRANRIEAPGVGLR